MRRGVLLLVLPLIAVLAGGPHAAASQRGATLHEPIPPDAREDLAMHVSLDGDLPAALQTPSGVVSAPDPRAMPSSSDKSYGSQADPGVFSPDRDTRRPEVSAYDDPFTPSTAPFKRLEAFDAVREDYTLYVRDTRLVQMSLGAPPGPADEAFYADIVVDMSPGTNVRIPSVGPGARIVRARLGIGADDVAFHVVRDGADDWFLQAPGARVKLRARLVMELAIPRAAFGGEMGNPSWSDLPAVPPLPENVTRDASQVRAAIGVSRSMRPRDAIGKLVQYFRGFADSDDPPTGQGNVYLDLALSKKGVCRHRAFAFLVTAQSLGVPTRLVLNEAHAWVEIHDGALWRRVDLGGAGRMAPPPGSTLADRAAYRPPPDTFSWPQNSRRGDDMIADARAGMQTPASGGPPGASSAGNGAPGDAKGPDGGTSSGPGAQLGTSGGLTDKDDRAPSAVTLAVTDSDPHRGLPLHVSGDVRADGEACAHVAVEVWLRDAKSQKATLLGTLATGDDGTYAGGIVVPGTTPLGDYDVFVRTPGDARCGSGGSN